MNYESENPYFTDVHTHGHSLLNDLRNCTSVFWSLSNSKPRFRILLERRSRITRAWSLSLSLSHNLSYITFCLQTYENEESGCIYLPLAAWSDKWRRLWTSRVQIFHKPQREEDACTVHRTQVMRYTSHKNIQPIHNSHCPKVGTRKSAACKAHWPRSEAHFLFCQQTVQQISLKPKSMIVC